jgi:hypothetical protein
MKKNNQLKKQQSQKPYELGYSEELEAMVFNILDADGMFPCYLRDPEAGMYKIIKTRAGRLQMSK